MSNILKLKRSNCKNCYKCIRNCPVKSIRFSAGQANIVPDECILCGQCFVVCPQNAKQIVSELENVQVMLAGDAPVIASVAPSFTANYNGVGIAALKKALLQLGFADVQETAQGATIVKREYERLLHEQRRDVLISSCCHSVNLLIQKHFPQLLHCLADVVSPMQAHCADIKHRLPGSKCVFIGPCVAKKDEAEHSDDTVDAVLTFEELSEWLQSKDITLEKDNESTDCKGRTRLFPTAGGILKSMDCNEAGYIYLAVDGVDNCIAALRDIEQGNIHNCFIEMSACAGSCIGGPVMEKYHRSPVRDYAAVCSYAGVDDFAIEQPSPEIIKKAFNYIGVDKNMPGEAEIKRILALMGKHCPDDELNCGSCGYNSCREKAVAVYQGKADLSMCLPFLKEKAESFSDNILNNTPNGIILLNDRLEVQQINRSALSIFNLNAASDLLGEPIVRVLDPTDFMSVLSTGKGLRDSLCYLAEYRKYVERTVVFDKTYRTLICILRDVTEQQQQRERKEALSVQTMETADRVVDKQMRIVQEIASLLGETAAETKIALTKLKESMSSE